MNASSLVQRVIAIALAVSGLGLATGCRGSKSPDPPVHPNLNMDFQAYYKPQEQNAWFPDHRAARDPVAGTVAQGYLKADDAFYLGRGTDGRLLDGLPPSVPLDEALLERGEARFAIYCAPCHAKTGYGDGVVAQRGLKVRPANLHQPRLAAMPLGYFFNVITFGKGMMLAHGPQIAPADRWAIAAWVRVLQVSQRADLNDIPESQRATLPGGTP